MAGAQVDAEVGEYQVMSATAAESPRSPSEVCEVLRSRTCRYQHANYVNSKILDCDGASDHSANSRCDAINHDAQDDEEWSEQEEEEEEEDKEILHEGEIYVADGLVGDAILGASRDRLNGSIDDDISDNEISRGKIIPREGGACAREPRSSGDLADKLEIALVTAPNCEIEGGQKREARKTVPDNDREATAVRGMKIATLSADNRINHGIESARASRGADKTIGSGTRERAGNVTGRKGGCDEVRGLLEISSPRNRAYPHGDDVAVAPSAGSRRGDLRGEAASRKVVHSKAKAGGNHVRSPGRTRRFAAISRPMDLVPFLDGGDERSGAKRCESCGESHYAYAGRYAHLCRYAGYSNREDAAAAVYEVCDVDAKVAGDSRLAPATAAMLYRSRSLPRLSVACDSGVACSDHAPPPGQTHDAASRQLVADFKQLLTLKQHYYPEGGWGWVVLLVGLLVQILSHGTHGAVGVFLQQVAVKFGHRVHLQAGWLGAMSTGVALLVSPVTIAFCRRKSTRVTAVLGGLVTALGCLFTSFASQFHQLFFSYGTVVGIGVGMTRDCSTLMVAQYFKRKREFVEIFIVSGSGLGIAVMSAFIKGVITKKGWRLGLQAVTGVVFITFILGTFYRSASLYHPQRRAILHLKNQKRKIKDKNKTDERPPFFDFSTLRSKTVRILLVSTGISAFGINTPIFYLAHQAEEEGLGDTVVLLQAYLGLAWTLGCAAFGLLVVHRSVECRIARQYLMQAAVFVCGVCILAFTAVQGNYHGYVMFAWIYGIFCGGYHYSLKMYTYERVRARNFARTWGFVQCSQAIPIAIGVPISGYINVGCGGKAGYYFSSTCVLVGSFTLFFIDLHRRNLSRHKHTRANGTKHLCASESCPQRRRASFSQEPDNEGPHVAAAGAAGATAAALVLGADIVPAQVIGRRRRRLLKPQLMFPGEPMDVLGADKPELTCISEEGIADMDLPDNLLEDLDYMGDCITSCNKVENYLMLSEFENNLIAEMPIIMDRRGRRWSLARSRTGQPSANYGQASGSQAASDEEEIKSKWRFANVPPNSNARMITVIDEASA